MAESATPSAAEATEGKGSAAEATEHKGSAAEATPESSNEDSDATKRARHWEREAGKANRAMSALQTEVETLRTAQLTEQEKAVSDALKSGRTEAEKEWKGKYAALAARSSALAVLGGRVTHPELLLPMLDLSGIELDDDGNVLNREALVAQVDSLVAKYGDLAVTN